MGRNERFRRRETDEQAELRNHIYGFIIQSNNVWLRRLPESGTGAQSRPPWHTRRLADFPLTQVCRKIRAEYLPIYQARHKIRIQHGDADAYFRDLVFHPARGKLVIAYRPTSLRKGYQPFDILPLRRRLDTAPLFKVGFSLGTFHLIFRMDYMYGLVEPLHKFLHALIHASPDTALATFIDKAVTAVELCSANKWGDSYRGFLILFRIKPELWERWMHAWTEYAEVLDNEQEDEVIAGMSAIGMDFALRRFIAFK